MFFQILRQARSIKTIVEFVCNIGLNLQSLNRIDKRFLLQGFEINQIAVQDTKNLRIARA
jgi:hypothetical protein